jgi:5S rRNA maturation endonuclease (ribonuclease M5)
MDKSKIINQILSTYFAGCESIILDHQDCNEHYEFLIEGIQEINFILHHHYNQLTKQNKDFCVYYKSEFKRLQLKYEKENE